MPELGQPVAKTTADFGGYSFALPEINPVDMKPKLGGLLDSLFIVLAYMNNPKVNEALTAFGIQIVDNKGKPLFPRSDT